VHLRRRVAELGLELLTTSDICYASAVNSFVILPDGWLAKCTVLLDKTIGRLNYDGAFSIDEDARDAAEY